MRSGGGKRTDRRSGSGSGGSGGVHVMLIIVALALAAELRGAHANVPASVFARDHRALTDPFFDRPTRPFSPSNLPRRSAPRRSAPPPPPPAGDEAATARKRRTDDGDDEESLLQAADREEDAGIEKRPELNQDYEEDEDEFLRRRRLPIALPGFYRRPAWLNDVDEDGKRKRSSADDGEETNDVIFERKRRVSPYYYPFYYRTSSPNYPSKRYFSWAKRSSWTKKRNLAK